MAILISYIEKSRKTVQKETVHFSSIEGNCLKNNILKEALTTEISKNSPMLKIGGRKTCFFKPLTQMSVVVAVLVGGFGCLL